MRGAVAEAIFFPFEYLVLISLDQIIGRITTDVLIATCVRLQLVRVKITVQDDLSSPKLVP